MKVARRTVQRGGHLQFENVMYRGEHLEGYAGETVSVRYDPRDITTIWIYRQEKQQEVFLTRAHAQELETEQLSVDEAKASAKRLREAGKTVSNQSILLEVMEREALSDRKKSRKQRFHLNPFPSAKELEGLAKVVGVEAQRLREMLPPQGVGMKCDPIRLCGACYAESPCHRMEWQFKSTAGCETHQLRLLSKCPRCGARFKVPALWEHGCCDRCRLAFGGMSAYQKAI